MFVSDFKTFPSGKFSALSMLYVQSQDLTGKTPEELLDMYDDAYQKIENHAVEKHKAEKLSKFK